MNATEKGLALKGVNTAKGLVTLVKFFCPNICDSVLPFWPPTCLGHLV
jgi:hypothetical protein